MHKLLLVPLIVMVLANAISAQPSLSVKAGCSLTNVRGEASYAFGANRDYTVHYENKLGSYIGIAGDFRLAPRWYFSAELARMDMGFVYDEKAYWYKDVKVTYLSLPLSVRYQANSRFSLLAGPYMSMMLGEQEGGPLSLNNLDEEFETLDFGIHVGSEFRIYKGLGVGAKYVVGLANVDNNPESYLKLYNRALQLYTFYQFKFKRK